jgi:hypothetical protein
VVWIAISSSTWEDYSVLKKFPQAAAWGSAASREGGAVSPPLLAMVVPARRLRQEWLERLVGLISEFEGLTHSPEGVAF